MVENFVDVVFGNAVVAGVPLLALTFGFVQWLKSLFGTSGKATQFVSLGTGVVLGIGYQLTVETPSDFAGWFSIVVFGLALGLVASGVFDGINQSKS